MERLRVPGAVRRRAQSRARDRTERLLRQMTSPQRSPEREGSLKTAYLGLDLGGTGAKAGVFDREGNLLGFGAAAFPDATTPDGGAELPIETIYEAAREAVRQALEQSGARIRAMSISSQGQTFASLDSQDRPLHAAIMWYDSRAGEQAEALRSVVTSGCSLECIPLIQPISSAPKVMWLRERYPEVMRWAQRYLLLPDYFAYRLTGDAVNDPVTALSSGLYVEGSSAYCPTALKCAGIEEGQVARVQPPGTKIAKLKPEAAREWRLSEDTLLVTGTNDQFAGALGAGNCAPGVVSETTGSCLALVTLAERAPDPVPEGLLVGRYAIPDYYFLLAYSKTAGLVLDWFSRTFCPNMSLRELDALAANVPPGSGGLTVLPHFEGAVSPHPDPDARGIIAGLSLGTTAAEVYRAILESLCFGLRENLEFVASLGAKAEVVRSIGGGAKSDLWLQMKADVTGIPVERPAVTEAATLGAAMLAAVGLGDFDSLQECSKALYRAERVSQPDQGVSCMYAEPYRAYLELFRKVYGR